MYPGHSAADAEALLPAVVLIALVKLGETAAPIGTEAPADAELIAGVGVGAAFGADDPPGETVAGTDPDPGA